MASQDINSCVITGRLTKDAELRTTQTGKKVLSFTFASNRLVKRNDQWESKVSFIDGTLFGSRAESLAKYLLKGMQVTVHGVLDQTIWVDKQGNKKSKLALLVDDIQMLGGKKQTAATAANQPVPTASSNPNKKTAKNPNDDSFDDIPF